MGARLSCRCLRGICILSWLRVLARLVCSLYAIHITLLDSNACLCVVYFVGAALYVVCMHIRLNIFFS